MNANTLSPVDTKTACSTSECATYTTSLANITETPEGYLLEAEVPGVRADGLDITVENGQLVIVAKRPEAEVSGQRVYTESRRSNYRRVFELDASIDSTKITAALDRGVLKLTLPKSESLKPRKIQVS